jgi:hypothetical protein
MEQFELNGSEVCLAEISKRDASFSHSSRDSKKENLKIIT